MRTKPYPLTQNVGGMDVSFDPVYLTDMSSPNLRNIRADKGIIKKDLSWLSFSGTTLDGTPMLFYIYKLTSGTTYYVIFTTTKMYKYTVATRVWTDVTPGTGFTGDASNRFSAVTFNDQLIFCNGKDSVYTFNGTTATALSNAPTTCRALMVFMNHLIALGTTESGTFYPFRVRWTTAGSETGWTSGTSGYIDLVDTPDWCVAAVLIRSKCFVFKQSTIWELVYIGGSAVFDFTLKIDEEGTEAPQSITQSGETVYFMGKSGIFNFDGARLTEISKKIFPLLYEPGVKILNSNYTNRSCAIFVRELNQYWICIPTTTAVPSTLLKCDISAGNTWTRKDSVAVTAFGKYSIAIAPLAWSAVTGAWTAQIGTWRRAALASGAPTTLVALSTGLTYEDDRSTYSTEEMVYETKDFLFGHSCRVTGARIEKNKGACTLYYSIDGGLTWSSGQAFGYSSDWVECFLPLNLTTQLIRFKVTSTAQECEIRWIEPWYITRSKSKTLTVS